MPGKVILLFEIGRNLEHFEVLAKRQIFRTGGWSITKYWWI